MDFCETCPNNIRCGFDDGFHPDIDNCLQKRTEYKKFLDEHFIGRQTIIRFLSKFRLGNERTLRTHLQNHCKPRESQYDPLILKCNSAWSIGNPVSDPASLENLTVTEAQNLTPVCDLFNEQEMSDFTGYTRQWICTMINSGSIPVFWPKIGNRPRSSKKWLVPYRKKKGL